MEDHFLTLTSTCEGYYMERGSKFLAYGFPVQAEAEAQLSLQKIKKDHPKARHYCTALRLFPDASLERSSDDGEPSGSAGRPILGQLIKNNLTNVFVVVVRYFGGTKLGIPGLIEAYKTSTANALATGNFIEKIVYGKVEITIPYETFPNFLNFCKQNSIPVFRESFSSIATLEIGFKKSSLAEELKQALHQYSQMDFDSIDQFATHLGMNIEFLSAEEIR